MPLEARNTSARVILALDLNAFYANALLQLPENASLVDKPVGVVQKHLVVTSNYIARARGVEKMTSVTNAKVQCPEIVLIDGSDLAPFRAAAADVRRVVRSEFPEDTPIEYLGLDELFVDITAVVSEMFNDHATVRSCGFHGHVLSDVVNSIQSRKPSALSIRRLQLGSLVASNLRQAIRKQTGLSSCAGIGNSKLAAKIAAGLHKPDDQTTIISEAALASFLANKPPTAIPGFGNGYARRLAALCESDAGPTSTPRNYTVETLADTFATLSSQRTLAQILGISLERVQWILLACRGYDESPVKPSSAPMSISCEDSMRACTDYGDLRKRLVELSLELVTRLVDDIEEYGLRYPTTLNVKFRFAGTGYRSSTRAARMPTSVHGPGLRGAGTISAAEPIAEDITKIAFSIIRESCPKDCPFAITLLGVGAGNFLRSGKRRLETGCMESFWHQRDIRSSPSRTETHVAHGVRMKKSRTDDVNEPTAESEVNDEVMGACPVCGREFRPKSSNTDINKHLDKCLEAERPSRASAVTKVQTARIDEFFRPSPCRKRGASL